MMDMSGQIIDQYRIESLLDSGPTGETYRALDLDSEQPVALTILHERYVVNRDVQQQMLDRFRAAVGLSHPHLIHLYAVDEEDGRIYIVSELEQDGSLRDLLDLGPREAFPLYMGIDLIRQAAEGLAAAHRNGTIHGTIEPENLLLRRVSGATNAASEYQVKLGGFGLTLPEGHHGNSPGHDPVGNPAYLSPEQIQGGEPDERSDVYSLGVVLFEVATGSLPFNIRTVNDAMVRHVHARPPSPRQTRPDIPEALSAIILRCLETDPANRVASAGELASALEALIPAGPRPPEGMAGERRDLPATEGVHLLVDREQVQVVPGNPETLTITLDNRTGFPVRAMLTSAGIVPDWIRLPPGAVDLPPRSQVSGPVHILAGRKPESIAGDHLLVLRAHVPGRTEPVSEVRVRITVVPFTAMRVRLEPPVTTGRTRGTYQVALENLGNERRRVVPLATSSLDGVQFGFNPPQVMVEPGRRVYSRMTVNAPRRWFGSNRETHNFSLAAASTGSDGDDTTPPIAGSYVQQPMFPVWALPVTILAIVLIGALLMMLPGEDDPDVAGVSGAANATATVDPDAAAADDATTVPEATPDTGDDSDGAPVAVDETQAPDDDEGADPEPDPDPDPTEEPAPPVLIEAEMIAFTSARDGNLSLFVVSPDGSRLNQLISEPGDDWAPAWSNDGSRIAWNGKVGGYDQIFVASSIGEDPVQLTMDPVNNRFPVWSPDDSRIIFNSGDGNETDLYMIDVESGELQQLTTNDAFDGNPCWAEGGERIIFVSNRTGSNEVFSMAPDGSDVEQLTNTDGNNFHPKCSPDGERIVFVSDRDGDRDIYVMDADGTDQIPLITDPTDELAPVWSPDSSRIAFLRVDDDEAGELYVMDAGGSNEEFLAGEVHTADPNITWSPDGTRIAFLRLNGAVPDIYVVTIETGDILQLTTSDAFDGNATWNVVQTWE